MKKNYNSSQNASQATKSKSSNTFKSVLIWVLILIAGNAMAQNLNSIDNVTVDELFERLNEIGNYAGSISDFFTEEELLLLKTHMSIKQKGTTQNFISMSVTTAYCAMNQTDEFGTFDTSDGTTVTAIGPSPTVAFENAGAINPADPSTAWVLANNGDAYIVDVATGTYTSTGNINIDGDDSPNYTGAEFDPTTGLFYAIDAVFGNLYQVNVPCHSATLIGSTGANSFIALAIDGNGNAYSYSVADDSLYSIDLGTGAATLIGPIGFNANFGQGMFWDSASDTVLMTAFNGTLFDSELRSVNTTTGATTLINQMNPGVSHQYAWASTPFTGVPPSCTQPINLLASNVTANSADLTWCQEATAALGYEWVVMPFGVSPVVDGSTEVATDTTDSLTTEDSVIGLNSETTYDAYVRSLCSASETSDWSLVESFTTASIFVNVIVQDITVQLDINGEATITPAMVDNGSSADAGIGNLSLDITDFDCGDIGDNSVTLTVTDIDGNSASATATVTVEDSIAPTALTQDITVALDANGNVNIFEADVDNGSSDNCGIVSSALDISSFDCSDLGTNTVTLTVTDASGNSSSATAVVTVIDDVNPVALAQDISVSLDVNGQVIITAADIDNGSSDNCGIVSSILDISSFDCSNIGANTVTLTVTDASGNSSSATAVVTIVDDLDPIVLAQDITVQLDASGSASISASDIDNGSSDNCGIVSSTLDVSTFDCSDLGTNSVALTVTDSSGNSSSATAVVTVVDNLAPVAVAQDISLSLDANGQASITASDINNGSSDNCSIVSSTLDVSAFDCSDIGANTVTLTVTDANGNSSSATAVVTVVDDLDPVVLAQDITVQIDANDSVSISASDIDNGSSDNCGIVSSTLDVSTFDCSDLGTNSVTLTVTDTSGNSSSATVVVTVEDDTNPVTITQDITVELDANGQAAISASDVDNGSGDNCSVSSLTLDITTFDCSDLGDNTVTLTVQDDDGNSSSATAVVTVVDNLAPVVVAQDISVSLDANGQATIIASDVDNGSSDNCGITSTTLDVSTFDCSDLGDNTVTLTAQDADGNENSATAVVTVVDNLDPVAVAQDISVSLDANGQASIAVSAVDNGSSDNCGIVSSTLDVSTFDCSNIGDNTVTLTVTDASGNSSSATAVVTVVDDVDPIAIAQDFTVSLDANGQALIDVSDIDNGSSDNCGIVSSSLDISTFDCSDVGTNLVTLTVNDASGNSSSATAVVTVEDNNSIVAVAQDITVQLDANGIASITVADIDLSTDNCSVATAVIDISTFDCSNIGDNVVTLTVTDASGNSDSTTATVTVEDNESPVAIAQNISVQLDANGLATITASDIDNGSTDNCSIVSTSIDVSTFDCTNVAANTVTLTVTDASGNTDTATAIVTVVEDIDPIAVAQDIVVELDANGVATISASSLDNGSSDNCGITNIYLDVNSFDCNDLGDNTVNFTVEDGSGNTNSTSVIVTVEDNLDPIAIGQDITVDLAGNPSVSITASDLDNGSFDNCGNVTLSIDVDTFTAIGVYPVVLTVEDQSGNTTSVTVTVTVEDTLSIIENEISKIEIKIYPVPTRDILFFESQGIIKSFIITDLYGKIILEQSNSHDQVYINHLSDGVYFIHFYLDNGQKIVKRFIIG